jgi:transcriptional regulator with XRE-family HTH domain
MALNIKKVIKAKGLTSVEVAQKMGITKVGLSQHINGNPSVEVLTRIADAIGVDISELFEPAEADVINCPACGVRLELKRKG